MNDLWFVTFGDSRLTQALKRIRRQAEKMGVFGNRIRVFSEGDLDADFREKMKDHLIPGSRGFGYWCWKPQVVLQTLREMKEGDVLLYADVGCHLNPKGLKRLEEYRQLAIKHGIVAFQSRSLCESSRHDFKHHFLPERQWTKMDLLKYFSVEGQSEILDSGQIGSGIFLIRNVELAVNLINTWRQCYYDHFELADDSPSKFGNADDFVENRHDQSIFSVLCKKHLDVFLSSGEYVHIRSYMPEGGNGKYWPEYWSEMMQFPIHAKRDLGKYTKMVECPDWLKPILGKHGRKLASCVYELIKPVMKRLKR